MEKVLWQELRWPEFEEAVKAGAIVIIPVGSTEQHGAHLPVNSDTNCCFAIAQRAALAIKEFPVLVLPPIWTGYSPYHMAYKGTITLSYHTFVELLTEIAASVYAHGFKKVLFLSGHGGNSPAIAAMRRKLPAEGHVGFAEGYNYWDIPSVPEQMKAISQRDKGSIGHAGELETSLQLYLQPELVGSDATWVEGVWGDPSVGTRKKGESIVRAVVDALVKLLREYHSGELENRRAYRKDIL